jgi:DNA invertase Pin-like site-specific DNA recombinase
MTSTSTSALALIRGTVGLPFVRVSTGSQDESTQLTALAEYAEAAGLTLAAATVLHGYSASKGEQQPAIQAAIEGIRQGRWRVILVTDSSRLDRREDLDAQAEILLAIRQAGGDIISTTEPQFGRTDFAGRIVTLVAQYGNAEKSRVVKDSTWRGVQAIIANKAWLGVLPTFWHAEGARYGKVATCDDPAKVRKIYEAIRNGHSLSSVAREHGTYPQSIRTLVRHRANTTGVFEAGYTYAGQRYTWQHAIAGDPPVDAELWHAANRVVGERGAMLNNTGGRPVSLARSWISGLLPCPGCGGHLYVSRGKVLNCGGRGKDRRSCGVPTINLASVIGQIEAIVNRADVPVYRFQRVSGNQGELDEMTAELDRVRQTLATTDDDAEFDSLSARRKALREQIRAFELVNDAHEMTPTGEALADLWRSGDKREIFRAIQRYLAFYFLPGSGDMVWLKEVADYPGGALIELNEDVCVRFPALAPGA